MKIEIVCDRLENAVLAAEHAIDRFELCTALSIGGLTPTPAFIKQVSYHTTIPIMALIRPRGGSFCYSEYEKRQYLLEVEQSLKAGAQGIVIGALSKDNSIDEDFIRLIRDSFPQVETCFHRAFDFLKEPEKSLDVLIDLKIDRLLTSGQKKSAYEGRDLIKKLIKKSAGRIVIMPGAGITAQNISALHKELKFKEIHLSSKKIMKSDDQSVPFTIDEWKLDENALRQFIERIKSIE